MLLKVHIPLNKRTVSIRLGLLDVDTHQVLGGKLLPPCAASCSVIVFTKKLVVIWTKRLFLHASRRRCRYAVVLSFWRLLLGISQRSKVPPVLLNRSIPPVAPVLLLMPALMVALESDWVVDPDSDVVETVVDV